MKVYANIRQVVTVNPIDVIEQLISKEIGSDGWITEEDGKYFQWYEASAGLHSYDNENEISKEKYDYVIGLQFVLAKLKEKK